MSATTKSPRAVALSALAIARDALPAYSHRSSPKTFTQAQLFACLVLKTFHKTDFRGAVAILHDMPGLVGELGLKRVPHFTTLHKAAGRLLRAANAGKLLGQTILAERWNRRRRRRRRDSRRRGRDSRRRGRGRRGRRPGRQAAADSSGLECGHTSRYYIKRRRRGEQDLYQTTTYKRYAKLEVLADTDSHLVLAVGAARGPSPDAGRLIPLLEQVTARAVGPVRLARVLCDAGYDSEPNHRRAREAYGARALIPATTGRPGKNPPAGYFRRRMRKLLKTKRGRKGAGYGQRWQVETVFSMIKRLLLSHVAARSYWPQCRELWMKAITLNIMIIAGME